MDFKEWETQFFGSLHALLAPVVGGTIQMTTVGLTFGGYVVHVKERHGDCVIWVIEDASGASAVDGMKWHVSLSESDPYATATEVADWLRPRIMGR